MSNGRRPDVLAVLILAGVITLLFADVLAGSHMFYRRDLAHYYYPMKLMLRETLQAGEFPFWTRMIGAGQPVAANPEHAVFYPGTWLVLLPDYFRAFGFHILAHLYIAVFAMYALLRSMAIRATAAFAGALAFGLGGVFMSYINLLPIMFCAAWLPLTCLYLRKFLRDPRLRWLALSALFLGLQCLVGEPTTILQTGLILGSYALYRGFHLANDQGASWKEVLRVQARCVGLVAVVSLAGFAVGAAQLLPAAGHVGDSVRARGFEFTSVSTWSMPWAKLAELVYPNVLGYVSAENSALYWGRDLYPRQGQPFLYNIYPGLLATAVAFSALFARRRGSGLVLILIGGSFLVALGSNTPLLRMLYDAGFTSIRYPEKFALTGVFAIIVFSAKMLQRMFDGDSAIRRGALFVAVTTGVVALVPIGLALTPHYMTAYELAGLGGIRAIGNGLASVKGWMLAAALSFTLALVLWSFPRVRPRIALLGIGAYTLASLVPIAHQLNPRLPANYFLEAPPIAASLPPDRDAYRVFFQADWEARSRTARRYFSHGPFLYWILRAGLYPMMTTQYGVATVMGIDYDRTELLPTADFTQSMWEVRARGREDWWRPFMAMSNAWFRAVHRDYETEFRRARGKPEEFRPIGFLATRQWPRYYFASEIVTIRGREDFVEKLARGKHGDAAAFIQRPAFPPAPGVVRSWSETSSTATIDVESSGSAFLVMSVTPHKWWRITIDGKPARAVVTNVGYQGVVVPRGRHRIEMRYRNDLVLIGGGISLLALVFVIAGVSLPRRRFESLAERSTT